MENLVCNARIAFGHVSRQERNQHAIRKILFECAGFVAVTSLRNDGSVEEEL